MYNTFMSSSQCRVSCLQLSTGEDLSENWAQLTLLFQQALLDQPDLIVLPEVCHFRVSSKNRTVMDEAQALDGPFISAVCGLAAQHRVAILVGSFIERSGDRCANTSVFIDEHGDILATYRKMHLFDAVVDERELRESAYFDRGETPVIVHWRGLKLGLSICYDLRFPELYRYYAREGVDVIMVPASFTTPTGKAHWHVLCRARAIENLSFLIAPNQVGAGAGGVDCYGHSLIVGPWGDILAEAPLAETAVISAVLDLGKIEACRKRLPVLSHRHDLLKGL